MLDIGAPFPKPALLNPATRKQLGLTSHADVIAHFTASLLRHDGIGFVQGWLKVEKTARSYSARFEPTRVFAAQARQFAEMHVAIMDEAHFESCPKGSGRLPAHVGRELRLAVAPVFGVDLNAVGGRQ
jgi:hypothetical protein